MCRRWCMCSPDPFAFLPPRARPLPGRRRLGRPPLWDVMQHNAAQQLRRMKTWDLLQTSPMDAYIYIQIQRDTTHSGLHQISDFQSRHFTGILNYSVFNDLRFILAGLWHWSDCTCSRQIPAWSLRCSGLGATLANSAIFRIFRRLFESFWTTGNYVHSFSIQRRINVMRSQWS
jgi:hypothetical protein